MICQIKNNINQGDSEVSEKSIEIDSETHEYSQILDELCDELNKHIEDEIVWLYRNKKAPLYVITTKYNSSSTSKKDMIKLLNSHGIQVEDETHMRELVEPEISRKLHRVGDRRGRKSNAK